MHKLFVHVVDYVTGGRREEEKEETWHAIEADCLMREISEEDLIQRRR
jgi:hypothetical protein